MDYDNDVVYEPGVEGLLRRLLNVPDTIEGLLQPAEDDDEEPGSRWDWSAPPPPAAARGHHHHHRHGFQEMLNMMGGETFGGKLS